MVELHDQTLELQVENGDIKKEAEQLKERNMNLDIMLTVSRGGCNVHVQFTCYTCNVHVSRAMYTLHVQCTCCTCNVHVSRAMRALKRVRVSKPANSKEIYKAL